MMFSPKLYSVYKFRFLDMLRNNSRMEGDLSEFIIKQQDNMLFRQIRRISGDYSSFNRYCIFMSCEGSKSRNDDFVKVLENGIYVNSTHFTLSERSASMTRQGILSFVDDSVIDELNKAITMDCDIQETVLAKYCAYRGLMFSSCHCIEDWIPKIIIVPDRKTVIKDQKIKYVVDETTECISKETGKPFLWTQKGIKEGIRDVEINMFDGCGIHSPNITRKVQALIGTDVAPTSILWRAPYIKGVTHEVDYQTFCRRYGVTEIVDIWGVSHSVNDDMLILSESMFKGLKYFKVNDDYSDWERYWEKFHKYSHCLGVAKWNFSKEQEPIYTRSNYQVLQDLQLPYEEFSSLADYSIEWVEKIIGGDIFYTYCFLGLFYDMHKPMNEYVRAILKNPEMLKEKTVNEYVINLLRKYIDEFKCGKLWLPFTFKILAPDLYAFLQHIAGLKVTGCLKEDEFYSNDKNGAIVGPRLIERNPHICKSEHTLLNGINNAITLEYFSSLSNVCMINCKSITAQRLNGADYDGDLVGVYDCPTMIQGVDKDCGIVIDIEDKITSLSEEYNHENVIQLVLRTMDSTIGECSNCATAYHNKTPKSEEQYKKYSNYINLLSVITGKSIDSAKTGVRWNIPRYIAKYAKPLPYFMRYASPYYATITQFNRSKSNMNRLCMDIEKWQKENIRFRKSFKDFDYRIMIEPRVEIHQDRFEAVEAIFKEFCKELAELGTLNHRIKNFDQYSDWFKENYEGYDKSFFMEFEPNWKICYERYKKLCQQVCPDKQELANIAVILCYEKYPSRNKKFIWKVASEGVLLNIKCQDIYLPKLNPDGEYEYLGRRYSMEEVLSIDK